MNKFLLSVFALSVVIGLSVAAKTAKPEFSKERGFYDQSFNLIISSKSGGGIIKYTLNGSDPCISMDGFSSTSPAVVLINPYSNVGRGLTPGVVVRACVIENDDTSEVETHTYIFYENVKYQVDVNYDVYGKYWPSTQTQPTAPLPPNVVNWASAPYQYYVYYIDPKVVGNYQYYPQFSDALLSIPSLSLTSDPGSFFNIDTGIYNNPAWHGIEWERAGSIELIDPKGGEGFQVNTGIRMRGGVSRNATPKHSFRLFFRKEYGDGKLNYKLFEDEGVEEFDKIDLRSSQNTSWHMGAVRADYIDDLFAREIQGAMGQEYTKSRYYHLYLNGMYWGLYMTQERAEASFGESYFGGLREEYDVIKSSGPSYDQPPHTLDFTDGDSVLTYQLWQIAKQGFDNDKNYYKVLGKNPDGTLNPEYKKLVDEENLISYMMVTYFINNTDGPAISGNRINNFFGMINREKPDGFKFFIHDAEHTFDNPNENIFDYNDEVGEIFSAFNPQWLHLQLIENDEYRQKFSDLAYEFLFDNGALTPSKCIERYDRWVNEINLAIICESARWGFGLTKNNQWLPSVAHMRDDYLSVRTAIFIEQLIDKGWLINLKPVLFSVGSMISKPEGYYTLPGHTFSISNPNSSGDIYYTTDGTDPRNSGGSVSSSAILYNNGNISVPNTLIVTARVKNGNEWGPANRKVFYTEKEKEDDILISEINYHPKLQIIDGDSIKKKTLEFIEIKNIGNEIVDLTSWSFNKGIGYTFPVNSFLDSDSLIVIASNAAEFYKFYGFQPYGEFTGNFDNKNEKILLANPLNDTVFFVKYNNEGTWFEETDGMGFTLVYKDYGYLGDKDSIQAWRPSSKIYGSPGEDDGESTESDLIKITEILANSENPTVDAIELFNPNNHDVDISGWFLSDDKNVMDKWEIPQGTVISANGYKVFYEGHYTGNDMQYSNSEFGEAFSLSSAGETIYLFAIDSNLSISSLVYRYSYEPTEVNITFGDYLNSSSEIKKVQLEANYLGSANIAAKKSPVIFKTIMYHPYDKHFEFIVLKNRTDSAVNLFESFDTTVTWRIDGIGFAFPETCTLQPGDSLYLVEKGISAELFRNFMNIPSSIKIYNYFNKLNNGGEAISLQKPILIDDILNKIFYVTLEKVKYNDTIPWPVIADGLGYALVRKNEEQFANNYANWITKVYILPVAVAGDNLVTKTGMIMNLDGSRSFDITTKPLSYQWQIVSKPAGSSTVLSSSTIEKPYFTPDIVGNYIFSLKVSNGSTTSIPSLTSIMAIENRPPVASISKVNITTITSDPVNLEGINSYDPDYDAIAYIWSFTEKPDESESILRRDSYHNPLFEPDKSGKYKIQLIVTDGYLSSSPKLATVSVNLSTDAVENQIYTNNSVLFYPNPVQDNLNISFVLKSQSIVNLQIYDLGSREIFNNHSNMTVKNNSLSISFKNIAYSSGIYFIKLSCEEFSVINRIVYINN